VHFGEHHSQLFPFCEYVFAPGKSPVELQPEIKATMGETFSM
jgi:hypothetical protein